jgi:hypothetical protein
MTPFERRLGWVVMVALAIFAAYYVWKFLSTTIPFAFSGPEPWRRIPGIGLDVSVPLWLRAGWFAMWLPSAIATLGMLLSGIRLIWRFLNTDFFTLGTVRGLTWTGGFAAFAGGWSLLAWSFEPVILTLYSNGFQRGFAFRYDSGEIGLFLIGLGVVMLGMVLRLSMVLNAENKEIV